MTDPEPLDEVQERLTFGQLLMLRRSALGLTQQATADLAGVAKATAGGIERGTTDPHLSAFEAYAAACQVGLVLVPHERMAVLELLMNLPRAELDALTNLYYEQKRDRAAARRRPRSAAAAGVAAD